IRTGERFDRSCPPAAVLSLGPRRLGIRDVSAPAASPLRVLVLCDRWPIAEAMGPRIVSVLATRAGEIGVTLVAPAIEQAEADRLRASGVEVATDAGTEWLASGAADAMVVVIEGPAAAERFARAVTQTQPQAAIVYDLSGPGGDDNLTDRRAEVAILAVASVVLAPTEAHARFVREVAPSAEVVVAPPGTPKLDRALAHALALTGIAIPDAALT